MSAQSAFAKPTCSEVAAHAYNTSRWARGYRDVAWLDAFVRRDLKVADARQLRLGVVLRGDVRAEAANCAASVVRHLIEPAEAADIAVEAILVTYAHYRRALEKDVSPAYKKWLTKVALLPSVKNSTQVAMIASTLRVVLEYSRSRSGRAYTAIVLFRYDLQLKSPMIWRLLAASRLLSLRSHGMRFLFREVPSDFRSDSRMVHAFQSPAWPNRTLGRVTDTLHAFSRSFLPCFLASLWRDSHLHNLHNLHSSMMRILPRAHFEEVKFLMPREGAFDSNPCRVVCRPNPVFAMPRTEGSLMWPSPHAICQREEDFRTDSVSGTLCCPTPEVCCPMSIGHCADPSARLFRGEALNGSERLDALPASWLTHLVFRRRRLCPASEWGAVGPSERAGVARRSNGTAYTSVGGTVATPCKLALDNATFVAVQQLCSQAMAAAKAGMAPTWMNESTAAMRDWVAFCSDRGPVVRTQ